MSWTPTNKPVSDLPLVLAGPILRHTTPTSVSVWLALKTKQERLKLQIKDSLGNVKFESDLTETIQFGQNLHIVLVTASQKGNQTPLNRGEIYQYDVSFDSGGTFETNGIITKDTDLAKPARPITHGGYSLPTFVVAPEQLKDLKLVHASCRKPHGEGTDAVFAIYKMISEAWGNPLERPHLLLLTGDQIYADDVSDVLLAALMDASKALVDSGHDPESLPGATESSLLPGKRIDLVKGTAGFTSRIFFWDDTGKSHLLRLGEFFAMYLFAWSDVVWPETFPLVGDTDAAKKYKTDTTRLGRFRINASHMRWVLANVPTYMIFDDHEITDDWYLTRAWCERVLGKPLGRRVIMNGLIAYTVFQGWGNTPDRFLPSTTGAEVLDKARAWIANKFKNPDPNNKLDERLERLLGIPSLANVQSNGALRTSQAGSLEFHYTIEGPQCEIIVLDGRTWREFPGSRISGPEIIGSAGLQEQIKRPRTNDTLVTLVVAPGPVFDVPAIKFGQDKSSFCEIMAYQNDQEAWEFKPRAMQELLACLARRGEVETVEDREVLRHRVVLLSGDVHYSYAVRSQLWAEALFGSSSSGPAHLVVAQLMASATKNEDNKTRALHGNHLISTLWGLISLPLELPGLHLNNVTVGWQANPSVEVTHPLPAFPLVKRQYPFRDTCKVATEDADKITTLVATRPPDWIARTDFVRGQRPATIPANTVSSVPIGDKNLSMQASKHIADQHQSGSKIGTAGSMIVGRNNVGAISFVVTPGPTPRLDRVVQDFWWSVNDSVDPTPATRTEVSLAFDNPEYPRPEGPEVSHER